MIPSIIQRQLKQGVRDYLQTTFPITTPLFKDLFKDLLDEGQGQLSKGLS